MDEVRTILRRRAEALARRRVEPPAPTTGSWVRLSRGGTAFTLEASLVLEVARLESLTPLPGAPAWLAGIAPYRGRILAVYDSARGTAAGPGQEAESGRGPGVVAVLSDGTRELGVLADAVQGFGRPRDEGNRAAPPSEGLGRWAQGLGRDGTLHLDGARMLADRSLTLEDPM